MTATVDGAEETRTEVPFPAVYMAWDPTGSRIALSGNDGDGSLKLTVSVPDARRQTPHAILGQPAWS